MVSTNATVALTVTILRRLGLLLDMLRRYARTNTALTSILYFDLFRCIASMSPIVL